MSLQVRTTPEADDQIVAIDDWWRRNRPAAPDLFFDELAASFETIGHTPQIGRVYRQSPVPGTRRILLKGSRYHVYYARGADEVRVPCGMHSEVSGHLCVPRSRPLHWTEDLKRLVATVRFTLQAEWSSENRR